MVFVPAPNMIKLEAVYTAESTIMENVLHYSNGTPATQIELESCASAWVSMWNTYLKKYFSTAHSLIRIKATALDADSSPGIEWTTGLPIAGTLATDPLPANCAVEVIFYTDLRGRSYRGRLYQPGMTEGPVVGSNIPPANSATWQADLDHYLHVGVEPDMFDLFVVSKYHNNQPRVTAVCTPVVRCSFSSRIVSQRRRLPGRGI
jgi:hypothetical protein